MRDWVNTAPKNVHVQSGSSAKFGELSGSFAQYCAMQLCVVCACVAQSAWCEPRLNERSTRAQNCQDFQAQVNEES